jgi:hypothetical protein
VPDLNEDDDPPKPARRRRRSFVAVLALIIIGVLAVAGGGTGLTLELTRHATAAEARAAGWAELTSRWQRVPAGQIFPAQLSYMDLAQSTLTLTRIGIAPPANCRRAADPAVGRLLATAGCVTVLRATYIDETGAVAATIGIAVMRSNAAAARANSDLSSETAGVDVYTVPGTAAGHFGNADRQLSAELYPGESPYIILDTAGFTDGIPRVAGPADPALSDLLNAVPNDLLATLSPPGSPCHERDIRC